MKEILVPLIKFNLDGFIGKITNFLETQATEGIDPSFAISWVESPGSSPNYSDESGWDFRSKLLNDRVFLFFPFAVPDYKGSLECADGGCYGVPAEDDNETDGQLSVEEDFIGYLLRLDDGAISIASAICPLSGCIISPAIELLDDCKELEHPMIDFIQGFIRGSSSGAEKKKACR